MEKRLIISGLAVVFGGAAASLTGVLSGGSIEVFGSYAIEDVNVMVGAVALIAAAALRGRPLGNYASWQLGAVVVALALHAAFQFGQPAVLLDLIERSDATRLGTTVVAYVGFWSATFAGSGGGGG